MNFVNKYQDPLPLTLPVGQEQSRRQEIAGLRLEDAAMLAFNGELRAVHERAPSVDVDQIASLARWLQELPTETAEATLDARMAKAESLALMLDDSDWALPAEVAERGRRLLEYIERIDDLIPDQLPLLGRLDEALLIELCWSQFDGEVRDYLDYRRFCSEQQFRGSAGERRMAWESACLAQASAIVHRQQVNERGYSRPNRLTRPFRIC